MVQKCANLLRLIVCPCLSHYFTYIFIYYQVQDQDVVVSTIINCMIEVNVFLLFCLDVLDWHDIRMLPYYALF